MANIVFPGPKDPDQFPYWRFETLDISHDARSAAVWMEYRVDAPQCYTLQMLTDLLQLRDSLRALHRSDRSAQFPFRYLVMAARRPGVFSLGGDLAAFAAVFGAGGVSITCKVPTFMSANRAMFQSLLAKLRPGANVVSRSSGSRITSAPSEPLAISVQRRASAP